MSHTPSSSHICLITPGNLSSTPRLLREAQSLRQAGYRVTVVAGTLYAPLEQADRHLAESNDFTFRKPQLSTASWFLLRIISRSLRTLAAYSLPLPLPCLAQALNPITWPLALCAQSVQANTYHGHCLGGLFAATHAAKHHQSTAGFDIEDLHAEELPWKKNEHWKPNTIHSIMKQQLPKCAFITSASPGIAQESEKHYQIPTNVLLNAYPLAEAPDTPVTVLASTAEKPAKLYWFSQTIGPARGLEEALHIISRMKTPCELHLRGTIEDRYRIQLTKQAKALGLKDSFLKFLEPAPADQMVHLSSGYHLGLCLEHSTPLNKDLCLANKPFAYLLAGTPVWLSHTSAHEALYTELGQAACLTDTLDHNDSAQQVDTFLSDPEKYKQARQHAWQLGRNKYNWDIESRRFLELVADHT